MDRDQLTGQFRGASHGDCNLNYKSPLIITIFFNKLAGYDARLFINLLTPNEPYSGRTASLTSKRCILYIYSTNTGTEYFKHGIFCPFFSLSLSLSLQNAICFIILTYLFPVLFTFYIQDVLKLKKIIILAPKIYGQIMDEFIGLTSKL